MRQHDGVGQTVRRVVAPAELVRDRMHITDVGAREGHAGKGGSQRHLFARLQVPAPGIGRGQVFEDHADGRQCQAVGLRAGPAADEGFHRMGQGIHPGSGGDRGREPRHQHRIERCHARHHAGIDDDQLGLAFRVGHHGCHGDF